MGPSCLQTAYIIFLAVIFECVKARAVEGGVYTIIPTTLPAPVWPTVESGLLLLRPAECEPELQNCTDHGACARHGKRPVCLCSLGYHGDYCEIKTSAVPPLHVASLLFVLLIVYVIIHASCVFHRLRLRRPRSRSCESRSHRSDGNGYGTIAEPMHTVVLDAPTKPTTSFI